MLSRRGFLGGVAAALAAARLPKLAQVVRPKPITAITAVRWDAILKQLYPADSIKTMSMSRHPLLSMIKRDDGR